MKVPILLYHRLFDKEQNDENYEIHVNEFENHVRYLYENGFRSISFSDVYSENNLIIEKINKPICITFDDGSYSDYSLALPVLKKYKFTATFFITTNWINTENYMAFPDLKELILNGMSIQSHGMSHSFLSDLNNDDLYKELCGSKKILEENLDVPIDIISIPGGFYSRRVLQAASECGYKGACTSVPGIANIYINKPVFQAFDRFVITRRTSINSFKAMINLDMNYSLKCKALYGVKCFFKKLLGSRGYYAVWSMFFRKA